MTHKPIFYDATGRRGRLLSWFGWSLAVLSTLIAVALISTLLIVHRPVSPPGEKKLASTPLAATADPGLLGSAKKLAIKLRHQQTVEPASSRRRAVKRTGRPTAVPASKRADIDKPLTVGFYVNWDDTSYPALKRTLPNLDWVVPGWLSLSGRDMALKTAIDQRALDLIESAKSTLPIVPMLQNSIDGKWDGPGLARFLADRTARNARIGEIVAFLASHDFQGVTIDFEEVPPTAQKDLKAFLAEISAAFAPHGWAVVLAMPFDDPAWRYADYAKLTDFILLMAYDEHWEAGAPGSIASQEWFERILAKRMRELDPNRTILAIGNYGYDWVKGQAADDITFQEAVLAARDSEAPIVFDSKTGNPHFSYVEDDGKTHTVWFLDGVTAFNEVHAADAYRPAGYALWRLGAEDPSVWSVLGRPYGAGAPDGLRTIAVSDDIDFEGRGEILRVAAKPHAGVRSFKLQPPSGRITDETYTEVPTSFVVKRVGAQTGKLALTFDDGPDPVWTPQILDILKAKGVPATFFIIGENAEAHPDLVERTVAEGHDIGNHTFTHPNMAEISAPLATLELNATQRLFEALTGRSMRLFRPPYLGDAEPTTREEIVPVEFAQAMGYVTVGLRVDPDDWQAPPADTIIERVLSQVADPNPETRGNIILLHDSGGDRSQTVAALPRLIDALRAKGYAFVSVAELAGITRDQAMPPVPASAMGVMINRPVFLTLGWLGHLLNAFFVITICLGALRLLFLCVLGFWNRWRETRHPAPALPGTPQLISVLIPAHDEAKVIEASLRRVLQSDYSALEVIVIDDGSTDGTSDIVQAAFASEKRVSLITIPNCGKAGALNRGLARATGRVVVALDADTQFATDTISQLARWFADPLIGAVAGNAKVGNRINTITRWQALEYITAQNLERRALAALGCLTVVPGAVGAWRGEALVRLGGFPADTLAEDQDLTIAVQKAGYRVLFDSEAVAWTEAPDSVRGLLKQRFRWAFGTLQCLWKHRDVLLRRRYGALGLVAMPQVWLFQVLLSTLAPVVDLLFVGQIVSTALNFFQHRQQFQPEGLIHAGLYYAAFMAIDLGAAVLAMMMERKEEWRLLWWLVLQRFGYRQLMYFVVVKSVLTAIRGPLVGWGHLQRKASVTAANA